MLLGVPQRLFVHLLMAYVRMRRVATEPMNPSIKIPLPGVPEKTNFEDYLTDELVSPAVPEITCNDT